MTGRSFLRAYELLRLSAGEQRELPEANRRLSEQVVTLTGTCAALTENCTALRDLAAERDAELESLRACGVPEFGHQL